MAATLSTYGANSGDPTDVVVYAVHGRGQNSGYMSALAERIDMAGITYLLPQAADDCWYPARFTEPIEANQPDLDHALDTVSAHLTAMESRGFAAGQIVLLGFSQGACLLSEYLLRTQRRFRAAAILTGGYLGPHEHAWVRTRPGLDGMPVLLTSSTRDEWVPVDRARATAEAFVHAGASVTTYIDDDPVHQVNDAVIAQVRRLLAGASPHH